VEDIKVRNFTSELITDYDLQKCEYKSPINVIAGYVNTEIVKQEEAIILNEVRDVGVTVDKNELIKALQYDRSQYEKGKSDGIKEFLQRLEKHQKENWIDNLEYGITWNDLEKIAKEMGVDLSETD
jgi:hypothetical protein